MSTGSNTADYPQRVRLLVLRMLVLSVAVGAVFLLLSSADAGSPPPSTRDHVVAPGESLWVIAQTVAPGDADLRPVVRMIQDLNGLSDGTIRPGQVLALPGRQ